MRYDKYCAVSLVLQVLGRHLVRVGHGRHMSTRRHAIKLPAPRPVWPPVLPTTSLLPLGSSLSPPSDSLPHPSFLPRPPTPLLSPSSTPFSPSPLPSSPLSLIASPSPLPPPSPHLPVVDDSLSFKHGCRKCIHLPLPTLNAETLLALAFPNLISSLGQVVC